jgi:hypothetical protein
LENNYRKPRDLLKYSHCDSLKKCQLTFSGDDEEGRCCH